MTDWIATRAEGEKQLAAFAPRMGRRYANGRNTDHGAGRHTAVSLLSPYIRRRLVLKLTPWRQHWRRTDRKTQKSSFRR